MWPRVHRGMTVVAAALATALRLTQSSVLCVLYLAAVVFLTFLAPYWLIWVQRYKKCGPRAPLGLHNLPTRFR